VSQDVHAAWDAVYAALEHLPGWRWQAVPPSYNSDERLWRASAFYEGHVHVFARRPSIQVRGMTEAEALEELAGALRDRAGGQGLTSDRPNSNGRSSLPYGGRGEVLQARTRLPRS
jgi:hypothetical protein